MQTYIGNKIINAQPMNRQAYNDFRGWELPADEDGSDEGYLVEYVDGGQANTEDYAGYVSWSPKDVFERAYKPTTEMSFGDALVMLKANKRVARAGWNGKGMWLRMVPSGFYDVGCSIAYDCSSTESTVKTKLLPWIGMKTADGSFVPWLASQTDMLAEDWMVV